MYALPRGEGLFDFYKVSSRGITLLLLASLSTGAYAEQKSFKIDSDNFSSGQGPSIELNGVKQNTKTIKGVILDDKGEALPGVSVVVKGTTIGAISDLDGSFNISVSGQDTPILVFSFVGMKSQEVVYTGQKSLKIVMLEDSKQMEEVVVTGIFKKNKETYTGAVSVVTEKELKSFGNRNLISTLRNIDPSFNLLDNNVFGSDPNKLPEVQMRGSANIPKIDQLQSETSAELNTPLIIVDGFEISLQRMMDLDDNEVKSITLLKDASATAIYGSRGSNGVIVIETKEPESGKLKLTYTGTLNLEVPDLSDYHLLDAREKLDLEYQSGYYNAERAEADLALKKKYGQILQQIERGVNTDWLAKPLHTGVGHKHNVKLEGGDRLFRYSATLQFNKVEGAMKGSSRDNFNGGINLSYRHEKLLFRNSLNIGANKSQDSPYGEFSQYAKMNPYWTPYDDFGHVIPTYQVPYAYNTRTVGNPLYDATLNTKSEQKYTNIVNNFSIEWRPISGLTLKGDFGINVQDNTADRYLPPEHSSFKNYSEEDQFRKGSYRYTTGKRTRYNASFTANYSKIFAEKHQVYAGFNMDLENNDFSNYVFSVEGFPSGSLDFLPVAMQYAKDSKPSGSESKSRRVGFVANLNYSYDNRYFVDGSFRTDGSSLYGADSRFAPFWSTGLGWNIDREAFMEDVEFINRLKLRASVGETGSNNFSSYESLATYGYALNDRYGNWMGANLKALPNDRLEWQKTMKYNVGLEVNMFESRWSIIADAYLEKTSGLMSSLELPLSNGFNSYKANIGEIENKGFELKTTVFPIRDTEHEIIWSITGSIVYNKDKIVQLSDVLKRQNEELLAKGGSIPNRVWKEGDSQNAIYVVPSLGIDPSTGRELYLTRNGEVSTVWDARDRVRCGLEQPKYRGNLNTMFRWKNLSASASFGFRLGGQQYNRTLIDRVENADKHYNVDDRVYLDRWKQPGDHTFFKGINVTDATEMTSRFVQDESTFTCQNVNVSYDFRDNKWLMSNLGMQNLGLRFNCSELFRLSTIKQERGTNYPFARQFSFSVTATF